MSLHPHHDGSALHVSTQEPRLGESVAVRVRIPERFGADAVSVRSNPDREPHFDPTRRIHVADGWEWWQAEVVVANPVHGYRWLIVDRAGRHHWLGQAGLTTTEPRDRDDFRLVAYPSAPEWARSAVLYQVFPDRFARSAAVREAPAWAVPAAWEDPVDTAPDTRAFQFYGGDLDGVRERLDHLVALGANLLYLTPFFPARSNHRYDATTFDHVDPLLGGDEALVRLVAAAHERGIRVIGDLTTNHTGDAHEWFQTALSDPASIERGFYHWRDDGGYESWLGVPSLPKLNWASSDLQRRFLEVVARYLREPFHLDGWRIDVANMTGRLGAIDHNAKVRQAIRATMIEVTPDTILVGESTNDGADDFQGDAWHGAMTYAPFTRPVWSWLQRPGAVAGGGLGFPASRVPHYRGREFVEAHTRFAAGFPWRTRSATLNALDTHDTPRFAGGAIEGAVPVAFGMSVTLPGIAVIWAGDEFGLVGADGEESRTPIPWGRRVLEFVPELVRLRREHAALDEGGMRWLHVDDEVLVYVREHADECVLVAAARGPFDVTLAPDAVAGIPRRLWGSSVAEGPRLWGDGPSFTAWSLPGVEAPAWT